MSSSVSRQQPTHRHGLRQAQSGAGRKEDRLSLKVIIIDRCYIALFSALQHTHCAHVACGFEWVAMAHFFIYFLYSPKWCTGCYMVQVNSTKHYTTLNSSALIRGITISQSDQCSFQEASKRAMGDHFPTTTTTHYCLVQIWPNLGRKMAPTLPHWPGLQRGGQLIDVLFLRQLPFNLFPLLALFFIRIDMKQPQFNAGLFW